MEPIEILILTALLSWATERVADALLNWMIEQLRRRNTKRSEHPTDELRELSQ
jgi:hypothetical protein